MLNTLPARVKTSSFGRLRRKRRGTQLHDLPTKYPIILADPAWHFKTNVTQKGRHVTKHYDTMSIDEIKNLPVADVSADDAILFLWVTNPLLDRAPEIIASWGFRYKTVGFTWIKQNKKSEGLFKGMGYYTRANAEHCLIATRGKVLPRKSKSVEQLIFAPRREHSRKPDEIYHRIEALYEGPYLELFSRSSKPGWTLWGNEVGKFETGTRPTIAKPPRGKLTAADVIEIRRQFHEDGAWQAVIAKRFGVSVPTISRCINHKVFGV
ncbi:hypothetical protein LB521_01205 [Mesorhizobium sp. BR-1-1-8]|uniref:MT-A70 family methyltransferase n=1 Tax=Mesorhizobium sp. BR-1-1-8 TaxID=2876659 RepID=UPI001CCE890B|nr:MT-A70 family methyltransferase [Mesorhizobium sp. BR-1-1-8]MBZ9979765.1 hypothetical protein [Mesorhizobium sp. BR-1-1-8]